MIELSLSYSDIAYSYSDIAAYMARSSYGYLKDAVTNQVNNGVASATNQMNNVVNALGETALSTTKSMIGMNNLENIHQSITGNMTVVSSMELDGVTVISERPQSLLERADTVVKETMTFSAKTFSAKNLGLVMTVVGLACKAGITESTSLLSFTGASEALVTGGSTVINATLWCGSNVVLPTAKMLTSHVALPAIKNAGSFVIETAIQHPVIATKIAATTGLLYSAMQDYKKNEPAPQITVNNDEVHIAQPSVSLFEKAQKAAKITGKTILALGVWAI